MAFGNWIKNQFRKVIQWENDDPNTIVWKFPLDNKQEIMRKSRLVVREGQRAMFIQEGKLADVFEPGTYELSDIKNIPVLTSLNSWKFAWESPYTGDVYFISTKQFINNKWGTSNPVMMRDPEFDMIRVRGFGVYSFAVSQPTNTMQQLFGSMGMLTVKNVDEYFKKIITSILSNVIAEAGYPALELASHYDELSDMSRGKLSAEFDKIGIEIKSLFIENLSLPEDVEKMMDKRTSLGVLGNKMQGFAQMESIAAMRDAANNAGGIAGAGVGIGAGFGIGKMFTDNIQNASKERASENNTQNSLINADKVACKHCGAITKEGEKFCPECGKPMVALIKCPKCSQEISEGTKFCPKCGENLLQKSCTNCGKRIKPETKFCPDCGTKQ